MLINNRRQALVPTTTLQTSIGSTLKRLDTVYGSNVDMIGTVRADKFVGDGSQLYNIDTSVFTKEIGSTRNPFKDIHASNIRLDQNVHATTYYGAGDSLTFDALQNSITPGKPNLSLGNSTQEFGSIFSRNLAVTDTVNAQTFVGDGSKLTNILASPDLGSINTNAIPASNEVYDLGTMYQRFNNAFVKNVSATGSVMGQRLMVTNAPTPFTYNKKTVKAPWSANDALSIELMDKIGSQIDICADVIISGVILIGESVIDKLTVRSSITPQQPSSVTIGTERLPFLESHICHLHIDRSVSNVAGDGSVGIECQTLAHFQESISVDQTVEAGNFVGDGRFIDNITHLGPINSNIEPQFDGVIDIGQTSRRMNTIYSKNGDFDRLTVNDELDVKGSFKHDSANVAAYLSGYCIPKEKMFSSPGSLTYISENNISRFSKIDITTGMITITQSGLYNIGFYAWNTNRSVNDSTVLWKIEHYNSYSQKIVFHSMKSGPNSLQNTNLILRAQDTLRVIVEPGYVSSGGTQPITIFERGALVFTLSTKFDSFV